MSTLVAALLLIKFKSHTYRYISMCYNNETKNVHRNGDRERKKVPAHTCVCVCWCMWFNNLVKIHPLNRLREGERGAEGKGRSLSKATAIGGMSVRYPHHSPVPPHTHSRYLPGEINATVPDLCTTS